MKRILNRLPGNERGVVLIIVLILLAVGGLTIAPMLSHMSTGLKAGQTYEKKTDEYYAADAGVEAALWQITREDRTEFLPSGEHDYYTWYDEINGKDVEFTITNEGKDADGNDVYLITSTATGDDGGKTAIESYVTSGSGFAFLLDNAVTSPTGVDLKNWVYVTGYIETPVKPPKTDRYDEDKWIESNVDGWPATADVLEFYQQQVEYPDPNPGGITIDTDDGPNPYPLGPLYVDGKLTIKGSVPIRLDGTVYVAGDIEAKNGLTMDLNEQTICAEGAINLKNGLESIGSGCIICVGKLDFSTNGETDPDGFIFLMSLEDAVVIHNADKIWGSIAGQDVVTLKNGVQLEWVEPSDGINFPGFGDDTTGKSLAVHTWDIS